MSVQDSIQSLWSLDKFGIREPNYTKEQEEKIALHNFCDTIQYNVDEKGYSITWPWKQSPSLLLINSGLAKGILLSFFKRYKPEPKYIEAINWIFEQQFQASSRKSKMQHHMNTAIIYHFM